VDDVETRMWHGPNWCGAEPVQLHRWWDPAGGGDDQFRIGGM